MKLGLSGLVLLGSMLSACQGSDGKSHPPEGDQPDPGPTPAPPSCVEKQKAILEQSGWNLTQGVGEVIDALLQKKTTAEQLPVCTSV